MSFLDDLLQKTPAPAIEEGTPCVRAPGGVLRVGLLVKVTGGQFNGLEGNIVKLDLTEGGCAAVWITIEGKHGRECVIEQHFLTPIGQR